MPNTVRLREKGEVKIKTPEKITIIAEIGENHHGNWDIAAKMIEVAARNGADIVKFQSYLPENFARDDPEYEWFKQVAVPDEKHFEFKALAEKSGVEFTSSPFTPERARFLCARVKCRSMKIASSVMRNYELLEEVNAHADTVKTVYMSSGMATMDEIADALEHLRRIERVIILHCVSQYPAKACQLNLRCIPALQKEFPGHVIGYSDHLPGLTACLVAVALGATVLEKHFTFSRHLPGTDHAGSMLPEELARLRREAEEAAQMLGSGQKAPTAEELKIRDFVRSRFKNI
ncbi:MAG: N-acetylneuraminate synthase family protein [Kiritimatiellaeota bacterium]|nr:N-acetylneuraminate synthase family protein [Kiritimatiellota bacterium]